MLIIVHPSFIATWRSPRDRSSPREIRTRRSLAGPDIVVKYSATMCNLNTTVFSPDVPISAIRTSRCYPGDSKFWASRGYSDRKFQVARAFFFLHQHTLFHSLQFLSFSLFLLVFCRVKYYVANIGIRCTHNMMHRQYTSPNY